MNIPTDELGYWRRVIRIAALCHDIGHLPFSHAAEKELLPEGWDHERITADIVKSEEMREIWTEMTPPIRAEDIAKVAVGPKTLPEEHFSEWEKLLSEIIVGNALGVDRIDYLLRDSLHAGVEYGKFDHHRLLDTVRILPDDASPDDESDEPVLGIEVGGVLSSQALLLARYFMYSQVYFHPVRRIYDQHLIDFLKEWLLPEGVFPTTPEGIQEYTDVEVMSAILEAAKKPSSPGHDPARRIVNREHFRVVYSRASGDVERHPNPGQAIYEALSDKYEDENVHHDKYEDTGRVDDLRVLGNDDRVTSALEMLEGIPRLIVDCVYVAPHLVSEVTSWLQSNREDIFEQASQEEGEA